MKNIKITYQYDGSLFQGFQRQPAARTVQGEIEKALNKILREEINLVSAGRTDRGVHALEQVSNFFTANPIPLEKLKLVLEKMLPMDIMLLNLEEAEQDFSARFSARGRGYRYYITWEKSPFNRRYATYCENEIEPERFNEILKPLIGVHDFSSFRLNDCTSKTTVREIYLIECRKLQDKKLEIHFRGNAFLKSQIRIIVGTALDIYFKRKPENYIKEMLEKPDRFAAKSMADPYGLYLCDIEY